MAAKKLSLADAIVKRIKNLCKVNSDYAREKGTLKDGDDDYVYVAPHYRARDGSPSLSDSIQQGIEAGVIGAKIPADKTFRAFFTETIIAMVEDGQLDQRWVAETVRNGRKIPGYYAVKLAGATRKGTPRAETAEKLDKSAVKDLF